MAKPAYLTKDGAEKLQKELEELQGPKRVDLAKRLRIAIQQGDLSENADYIATKVEQGFLEGRILEVAAILRDVIIIDDKAKRDTVEIGAHITIQEEDYDPETYYLVGANEANPQEGRISNESPIGRALMGKKVGESAQAATPNGFIVFKILEIK